jgi:light-regulated signal transduction histidine kinase (bacteriophytochrome)
MTQLLKIFVDDKSLEVDKIKNLLKEHGYTAEITNSLNKQNYNSSYIIDCERKISSLQKELRRVNMDLENFAYVASHDMQEPLRMVNSYVQLLQKRYKGKLDSQADDFIAFAVDGVTRMKTLLDDLLTYSRVSYSNFKLTNLDLNAVIRKVEHKMTNSSKCSKFIINSTQLPVIQADAFQMEMLFFHLLENGIKFNKNTTPTVDISSRKNENHWLFTVKDNGIGFEKAYYDKIFNIFNRLHNYSEFKGSGIGLALCKKILEYHNGSIWAQSVPGKGSTFSFCIPFGQIIPEHG